MPRQPTLNDAEVIARLLRGRRIAVVGASDKPMRPANYVPSYMMDHGYDIIPVNPLYSTVWGRRCYARLEDVPGKIDVVNVFRRSEFCAAVTQEAIDAGASGVWLQSGIVSDEARRLAEQAGIDYVEDRCIMVEHTRRGRK